LAISDSVQDKTSQPPSQCRLPVEEGGAPRKWGLIWLLVLIVLAGAGFYYYRSHASSESKAAPAPGGGRGAGSAVVSVAVAPALKQNVPYYLSGLGSVTHFNTLTVKSRLEWTLDEDQFIECQ